MNLIKICLNVNRVRYAFERIKYVEVTLTFHEKLKKKILLIIDLN